MKLRALFLCGLAVVAFEAGATEPMDPECRDRLTRNIGVLETAFAANRSQFDSQVDELLTKYAASHPAASKQDYKATFDAMFEERFRKEFTHLRILSGYKGVLEGRVVFSDICKLSEKKMSKDSQQFIVQDKALYHQIVGEMSKAFR